MHRLQLGPIDTSERVYVIAELGVNHDGSVQQAHELIDAAANADADAIKLQHFSADLLMGAAARLASYQQDAGETDPVEMLARLELPTQSLAELAEHAKARDLDAIVTIFSTELVAEAAEVDWAAFKIASPDLIHRPLLDAIAALGRPMLVSTGASTLDEVVRTRQWLQDLGPDRLAFMQCVSSYPAPSPELGAIPTLAEALDLTIGYSDHTEPIDTGRNAVRAGARVLERHLTLDRTLPGPDHAASLEPADFAEYVRLARRAVRDDSIEPAPKRVLDCEQDVRTVSRQSLAATRNLPAGHVLEASDLTCCRPGTGLPPFLIDDAIGQPLATSIAARMPLTSEHVAVSAGATP